MDRRVDTKGAPAVPEGPYKYDKSNLRQLIYDSCDQFSEGFHLASKIRLDGKFERMVSSGEGGSAFPFALVDLFVRDFAIREGKLPAQVLQNHTYSLPPESFVNALNIVCSYSGNTEEALSVLAKAIEAKLPVAGLASGGKLEQLCKEKGVPFGKLPFPTQTFQPRMGTGYQVAAALQLLVNHGLMNIDPDNLVKQAEAFKGRMSSHERQGQELAQRIAGKRPVIITSQKYRELGRVWSIKFQEHAKNPAVSYFLPEFNHNAMIGFTNLAEGHFGIFLRDDEDDPENLRRYDVTRETLAPYGFESEVLDLKGENAFQKTMDSIYQGDFVAYYLAEQNKVDPTPVPMVEDFKAKLDPNFGKK